MFETLALFPRMRMDDRDPLAVRALIRPLIRPLADRVDVDETICAGGAPARRLPETVLDGPALVRGLFVCTPPELVPLEARPVRTLRGEGPAFRDLFWALVPLMGHTLGPALLVPDILRDPVLFPAVPALFIFSNALYIARVSGSISDLLP